MKNKGFTIVEILITLFIFSVVIGAVYITYTNLLKGFKKETSITESEIETLIANNILRLDVEHIGYGISKDETASMFEWNSNTKTLVIRSTINNTNSETRGYLVLKCTAGSLQIQVDSRDDTTSKYVSVLDINKNFFDSGSISNNTVNLDSKACTDNYIYLAYPVRQEVYNGSSNGCNTGLCEQISYFLTGVDIKKCKVGNYNLIRRVGKGNTGGAPVMSCIADWDITVDLDTNGDGSVDLFETKNIPVSNSEIRNQVKKINIYILLQEGEYDPEFTFKAYVPCPSNSTNKCVQVGDNVFLKLPSNFEHYRWEILKIPVKIMNL